MEQDFNDLVPVYYTFKKDGEHGLCLTEDIDKNNLNMNDKILFYAFAKSGIDRHPIYKSKNTTNVEIIKTDDTSIILFYINIDNHGICDECLYLYGIYSKANTLMVGYGNMLDYHVRDKFNLSNHRSTVFQLLGYVCSVQKYKLIDHVNKLNMMMNILTQKDDNILLIKLREQEKKINQLNIKLIELTKTFNDNNQTTIKTKYENKFTKQNEQINELKQNLIEVTKKDDTYNNMIDIIKKEYDSKLKKQTEQFNELKEKLLKILPCLE